MRSDHWVFRPIPNVRSVRAGVIIGAIVAAAAIVTGCGEREDDSDGALVAIVGSQAENAYDAAQGSDWATASTIADTIRGAMSGLARSEIKGGRLSTEAPCWVAAFENAISRREAPDAARAANELTRVAAELSRPLMPPVPVEVTLLDYFGREVQLAVSAGDTVRASSAIQEAGHAWTAIKRLVTTRPGGEAQARVFSQAMDHLATARTSGERISAAAVILDEVDNLERLFPETGPQRPAYAQDSDEDTDGKVAMNVEPQGPVSASSSRPPCASATQRAIANPSPAPSE